MSRKYVLAMYGLIIMALFPACSTADPEIRTAVETRLVQVPVTAEVPITVEVPVTVVVTRLVEATQQPIPVQSISEVTPTPSVTTDMLTIGQEGSDAGQVYVLKDWAEVASIPHRDGSEVVAPAGGKFVVLTISFFNDGTESVDIYCAYDFGRKLIDSRGRQFDDTGSADIIDLYDIVGNTGCNDRIQPGFGSEEETIAFLVPADATPDYVMFWNPNELPEFSDSFGEKSAVRFRLD